VNRPAAAGVGADPGTDPGTGRAAGEHRRGMAAGVAAYGLWGLFPLYFHALGPANAWEVLAHRVVWSFLLVAIVLVARGDAHLVTELRHDRARFARIAGAGLLLSLNWLTYVWAVSADRVIDASLGYFINPIITVLAGVVLLGEEVRPLQRVAVGLGGLAVVVLTLGYGEVPWIALVLAVTFAGYSFLKKQVHLPTVASLAAETVSLVPVAAAGLVLAVVSGRSTFAHHDGWLDVRLVGLGVVTAVPLLLFGSATRRIPLVLVGLLQYLTPFGQLLLGWWWFGESMPPERWAGFGLIWAALGVLSVDALRSR